MISKWLALTALILFSGSVFAAGPTKQFNGEPRWDNFSGFINEQSEKDRKLGIAYMVSGAAAIVGGTLGYQQTEDPFARTVFTVSQSMGIAAIGYGTFLMEIGHEDRAFHQAVLDTTSLSPQQKDELLGHYLREKRTFEKRARLIRAFTHGFIAALNFYNGSKQKDSNLQSVHYFIGGINLVAAVSFSF
ncbi:MAG: hypothetical protein ABL958_20690 [Bdellovibrionia bacterium]